MAKAETKANDFDKELEDTDETEVAKAAAGPAELKVWDLKPDTVYREVPENLSAMWKGIQSNTPVKLLRGVIMVNVPGKGLTARTHGSFVLFNDHTKAVRISIKDMKMPNDSNLDCSNIEVHPEDVAPDFGYKWEGRAAMARGQSGKSLNLFNARGVLSDDQEQERSDEVALANKMQPAGRPTTESGLPAVGGIKMIGRRG